MANQPKKYKKFVATAATATLVASAIVPVASAASLSDISGNTHEKAINALVDAKVISGYPDGTFKPNKELTRSDVVKLLGKYLVSQGHSVPADATSNPRFSDLSSKTNKELLEYAAVVADAGVFAGSNGKLLAGDAITRENMAIVLVRMVNTLNDVSLEEYVASQDFNREVKDINAAKAEARTAIDVLDFYDITTVTNFLPKNTVTRGQFATFLNNVINADFADASATTGTVKAINATTVEVTFGEDVADIKALDFKINGLEVSNAVVKQTDKKTVVLTTSPQTAGVEYTVTVNGSEFGKFTGISAVVPTKVELVSPSVQGKLGQQVTVQAKVTVAAGQSAAGIPVTLFVPGSTNGVKAPITVEAVTDANGVATHTYTRYADTTDSVTVYATGDRSKFATGYVFWGVDTILSVEEVTTGSSINNGGNKTYKVTYKDPETGKVVPNKTLNVSFLENINVPINKISKAKVNGTNPTQLVNGTAAETAQIVTDSKGEALFTVTGENTEVTPVIFDAEYVAGSYSKTYSASLLQTTASKVKFAAVQAEYTIELKRDGGEEAARYASNGREYNVIVKDKAGNLAKNETVNIAFNEDLDGVISTQTSAYFIDEDSAGNQFNTGKKTFTVVTDSKGEASFIIGSDSNKDYATPVAWIDINSSYAEDGKLDQGESSTVGAISYFTDAKLTSGTLVGKNSVSGKKATDHKSTEAAIFDFSLANQSGKPIALGTAGYTTIDGNFTVYNDGAAVVVVTAGSSTYKVSPNRAVTVSVSGATPSISVQPEEDKTTSVKVTASGVAKDTEGNNRSFTIPTTSEVVAKFTSTKAVGETYTNNLTAFNTDSKTITFADKDAVKYAGVSGKKYSYKNQFGNTITVAEFEKTLKDTATAGDTLRVTYATSGDDVNISIISVVEDGALVDSVTDAAAGLAQARTNLQNAVTAVDPTDYIAADQDKATAAKTAAQAVLNNTSATKAQLENALTALTTALAGLTTIADESALTQARTNLENAVTAVDVTDYVTADQVKATAAKAAAQVVLDNTSATKAQLDNALTALTTALAPLKSNATYEVDGLEITFTPSIADELLAYGVPVFTETNTDTTATGTFSGNVLTITVTPVAEIANGDEIEVEVTVNGEVKTITLVATGDGAAATWAIK